MVKRSKHTPTEPLVHNLDDIVRAVENGSFTPKFTPEPIRIGKVLIASSSPPEDAKGKKIFHPYVLVFPEEDSSVAYVNIGSWGNEAGFSPSPVREKVSSFNYPATGLENISGTYFGPVFSAETKTRMTEPVLAPNPAGFGPKELKGWVRKDITIKGCIGLSAWETKNLIYRRGAVGVYNSLSHRCGSIEAASQQMIASAIKSQYDSLPDSFKRTIDPDDYSEGVRKMLVGKLIDDFGEFSWMVRSAVISIDGLKSRRRIAAAIKKQYSDLSPVKKKILTYTAFRRGIENALHKKKFEDLKNKRR
jgi:hypothetical protein